MTRDTTTTSAKLLLRPREAAHLLSISERTLWTLTARGSIPHLRLVRSVRYPVDELHRWISEQEKGGKA